jgi:hypothetical protein
VTFITTTIIFENVFVEEWPRVAYVKDIVSVNLGREMSSQVAVMEFPDNQCNLVAGDDIL